ncbi:MAG: hypothetical protein ACRBN8_25350 [Nannocystales bacterium]
MKQIPRTSTRPGFYDAFPAVNRYGFKGGLLPAERQLAVDVSATLDWSSLAELEDV